MKVRRAYCSACDRPVPVVLKPNAKFEGRPSPRDGRKLICLDYRVRCTGHMCPLLSIDESGEVARSVDLPPPS